MAIEALGMIGLIVLGHALTLGAALSLHQYLGRVRNRG
jgi:hypothetical protein